MSSGKKPQQESYYNLYRENSEAAKGKGNAGSGKAKASEDWPPIPHVDHKTSSVDASEGGSADETPASTTKGKERADVQQTTSTTSASDSKKQTSTKDDRGRAATENEYWEWFYESERKGVPQDISESRAATAAGEKKDMIKIKVRPKGMKKTEGEEKKK